MAVEVSGGGAGDGAGSGTEDGTAGGSGSGAGGGTDGGAGRGRARPVRLVCTDHGGDGPPLLLLHGLAGHRGEWDALAARFSATHRVVAFDARGSGESTRRPGDVTRAAHVRDVLAVARRFGLAGQDTVLA